jgi:hypothetical protein
MFPGGPETPVPLMPPPLQAATLSAIPSAAPVVASRRLGTCDAAMNVFRFIQHPFVNLV